MHVTRRAESTVIALAAVAAALMTAALQLTVRGGKVLLLGRLEVLSPDAIWMAPIAETVFFLIVALPFLGLTFVRPSRAVTLAAVFTCGLLAIFLAALQTRALHQWACLVLALGVGWRLSAFWRRQPERASLMARRAVVVLAALFTLASGIELYLTSDRGPAGAAPEPGAPNVLLLVLDTVGARHLSLYGYARETSPHLARVAGEGVTFDNAIAPSSWTLPSHASLFTGLPPWDLSARVGGVLDRARPTLAEHFAERGYRTAGFTANITYTGRATGLARGFQFYRAETRSLEQIGRQAGFARTRLFRRLRNDPPRTWVSRLPDFTMEWEVLREPKTASMVIDEFLEWQASATDRPFFAFLNFFDAHHPYAPPPPFGTRFAERPQNVDRYDGGVAYMDEQVGALVDQLRSRQLLDRTILLIAGDHGESFGEHGMFGHGTNLYREQVHVPLVMRYPSSVPANRRIDAVVSLADVGATLLELAAPGVPGRLPGASLVPLWGADTTHRDALAWLEAFAAREGAPALPERVSITTGRYTLMANDSGRVELYDWRADPEQLVNLADSANAATVRESLSARLLPVTGRWPPAGAGGRR